MEPAPATDRSIRRWSRATWFRRFLLRWIGYVASAVTASMVLHFAYLFFTDYELLPWVRLDPGWFGICALLFAVGVGCLWSVANGVSLLDLLALVTGIALYIGLRDHPASAFAAAEFTLGGFAWAGRKR